MPVAAPPVAAVVLEVLSLQPARMLVEAAAAEGPVRGEVLGFRVNRATGRPFLAGDAIEAHVLSDGGLCPSAAFVLPLLVLDINGVLGAREPFEAASRRRGFVVRESAVAFVEAALQLWEVGIWTASRRQTLDEDLRLLWPAGDALLFRWEQDACTNLWPRSSVVNLRKPLFLKELAKVWAAYPCYSAANTVLVDNHAEKFERNPLGTCISIPEFEGLDDGALGLDAELLRHLRAMAQGQGQGQGPLEYMLARAGSGPLFLAAHPVPPRLAPALPPRAPPLPPAPPAAPATSGAREPLSRDQAVLRFLTLTRHPEELDFWVRRDELPSTRAMNLRREPLRALLDRPAYFVCEKTDGVRHCLLCCTDGRLLLLDRAMRVDERVASPSMRAFLAHRGGDTVLDGELVIDERTKQEMFIVFDAIVVDGRNTGLMHSFQRRLAAAEAWLDALLEDASRVPPMDLIMKTQLPCWEVDKVQACFTEAAHGWMFSDGSACHPSDGLVFTPANVSYYFCMPLKWKPACLLTIDFSLSTAELSGRKATCAGQCRADAALVPVCEVRVERGAAWLKDALRAGPGDRLVVECVFEPGQGEWLALKDRPDKNVPNSVRSAFSTLEAVAEGLSLQELAALLRSVPASKHAALAPQDRADSAFALASFTSLGEGAMRARRGGQGAREPNRTRSSGPPPLPPHAPAPPPLLGKPVVAAPPPADRDAPVESHYDRIQRERWLGGAQSLDEKIAVLRKFQNWNKACMIKRMLRSDEDQRDLEAMLDGLNVAFDVACVAALQSASPRPPPPKNSASRISLKVLDLACGRGGDLNKWTRDATVSLYVGVDISAEELREAGVRGKGLERGRAAYVFHRSSCDSPALLGELYEQVCASGVTVGLEQRAHRDRLLCGMNVVWCQFALHYFCASRDSLSAFIANVSGSLARGGRFCASFPNPFAVISHLNRIAQQPEGSSKSGSDVCYISSESKQQVSIEAGLLEFGLGYRFTLGDAVRECAEFVVPLRALVGVAAEAGLRLVRLQPMHAFMARCAQDPDLVALKEVMQLTGPKSVGRPLSAEEWDAIGLYCLVVFEKA